MLTDPFSILPAAASLAAQAHAGQTIFESDVPYIAHPMRVALAVFFDFGCRDPEVIAAALLHDTLEKTALTAESISGLLGPRVLRLVITLTKEEGGDRKAYWKRLENDGWKPRIIKMADALDRLDCPPDDLQRRIRSARRALALSSPDEEPLRRAGDVLRRAIVSASARAGVPVQLAGPSKGWR